MGTVKAPTWRELARSDSRHVPPHLTEESSPNLGTARIPPERYTSHEFHRAEVEKIWMRTWQVACRAEEIPNAGDHFVYDVAGYSFLIVRQTDQRFKAFWNVCLHRGRRLCDHAGRGAQQFKCGYHAWTWKNNGELAFYPGSWDFPDVRKEDYKLREIRVDTWGGFVFVNPDLRAGPLSEQLGPMTEHFKAWPLEDRFSIWHVRKTINSNWKVAMEAFLEGYHLAQTHPQALPSVAEHATQYDVWDVGDAAFSRSITPTGVPSFHGKAILGKEADSLEAVHHAWALLAGLRATDAGEAPSAITDRASLAAWRRDALKQLTGADYSSLSDAEMLDSIQYWAFPNFCPWYGEGLPLSYVFRPNADTPDTCYFDIWMLIRVPDGAPRPPAADLKTLEHNEAFQTIAELGGMGLIFDQDDQNMPFVQAGMKTWPGDPDGCTLGRYQESRIRFFHQVLMRRLGQS